MNQPTTYDRLTIAAPNTTVVAINTTVAALNTTIDVPRVQYYFFDDNYHLMDENNITISGNKTLIVLVHGFRSSPWTGVVADLGKFVPLKTLTLVQWTNSNVVLVNWSKWTQKMDYTDVVVRLPTVATHLVDWLNGLHDRGIIQSFDDVTMIGHSLGAHLIGYAGHRLNGTIKRIIDLKCILKCLMRIINHYCIIIFNIASMKIGIKLCADQFSGFRGVSFTTENLEKYMN
ncbi:hypothetical protein AGLY_004907 [Aphis glycines]|uniref:Lipase domain-containing protein n=1 Tax=Aphis glycines TaxID=307491 RepID=A0A6G0TV72_APHGL|nr:hypothetical protein AGLY_004907 [Aphis glycines]